MFFLCKQPFILSGICMKASEQSAGIRILDFKLSSCCAQRTGSAVSNLDLRGKEAQKHCKHDTSFCGKQLGAGFSLNFSSQP